MPIARTAAIPTREPAASPCAMPFSGRACLPLSTCSCGEADEMRAKIRDKIAGGATPQQIQEDYRTEFGPKSIAIPSDRGLDRALWAVPVVAIAVAAGLLVWRGRKWVGPRPAAASAGVAPRAVDGYDAALDAELRKLDD